MPVVDASVIVDWVPPVPARLDAELLAPRLLLEEVAGALLGGLRRSRWSGAQGDEAQRLLRTLPVRLADSPPDRERAWVLARRFDNHPVCDMLHVSLAERRRTQLVTADVAAN